MPKMKIPLHGEVDQVVPLSVREALVRCVDPKVMSQVVAGRLDGRPVDLSLRLDVDAILEPVMADEPLGLEILRHSTAHLLAHAVKRLYPQAQVTIGPVIEDGFYYDFHVEPPFSAEDLPQIEEEMRKIVSEDLPIERRVMTRDEAVRFFSERGENYKAEIIREIPAGEVISLYRQGEFQDLCRGPHVPSTGRLGDFKLTQVAGAYWRGDSRNVMLTRVYGTAWASPDALAQHLERIAEAEKRDHRRLAKLMDLFHFQDEAPGMVFWHEAGWALYRTIEDYIRGQLAAAGYREVHTPLMLDRILWERSGHADKFGTQMFAVAVDNREYAIKPMNCPAHVQIFNQGIRSYRELPLRLAEFGVCHRNEPSGTLHGLLRARSFVQDDAHIFCTPDQVEPEAIAFIRLLFNVYRDFGFSNIQIHLSTRPEQRVGSDELWDRAEQALSQALAHENLTYSIQPGEGAFYGPKIEFSLQDTLGRVWQCGTLQLDYVLPERLGASFVNAAGEKERVVMLHRAILGSLERFIGILLEHHAGVLPLWLAPVQVALLTITGQQDEYARQAALLLEQAGFRVVLDLRNEKIGLKIRERSIQRVPYLAVIGPKEAAAGRLAVRRQNGRNLGDRSLESFVADLTRERNRCGQDVVED
jgi:threonyl-tRNA synthetase